MPDRDPHIADQDSLSSLELADPEELTGTPSRIQLAATDAVPTIDREQDAAIVESFIATLARIAHSVATRQKDQSDQGG